MFVPVHVYSCVCVLYVHACLYVLMYVRLYICMYICMNVSMCMLFVLADGLLFPCLAASALGSRMHHW